MIKTREFRETVQKIEPAKNQNPSSYFSSSIFFGLLAAILMGTYLFALQLGGQENNIALKFMKYIILFGIFGLAAWNWNRNFVNGKVFKKGIVHGAIISITAGAGLALFNFFISLIDPDWSFSKFGKIPDQSGDVLLISGSLVFEVFVFGMIINFIWLQYFKNKKQTN